MAGLSAVNFTDSEPENAVNFVSGTEKYFVPVEKKIDIEAEREKLEKELKLQDVKGFRDEVRNLYNLFVQCDCVQL